MGIIYFVYHHYTGASDGLEGFSPKFEKAEKRSLFAWKKKSEISSSPDLKVYSCFKPANDKPTTTPRASKKVESKSDAVSTRPHSH